MYTLLLMLVALVFGSDDLTPKHEAGRCAMRGHCSSGFFGGGTPCVDNGLAEEPAQDLRKQIIDVCGSEWGTGPVCCNDEQVQFPIMTFPSSTY